jgi:serine/threonine protein kinase HipA of HipAB toxin-antitoxin module
MNRTLIRCGVVAAAVLSTLVFGRDVVSYVKTFGSSAREAIKAEVPIGFEIERARDMVVAQSGKHFDPQVVQVFDNLLYADPVNSPFV